MKVAKIKGLSTILHQTKNNVAPRYLGTRESYGNFLDHKPSRDITNLLLTGKQEKYKMHIVKIDLTFLK